MKRQYWIISVLTALALAATGLVYKRSNATPASLSAVTTPKLSVELLSSDVASLAPVTLGQVLVANGSLRSLAQAQVKSQVSAVVMNVAVLEGQAVVAGQVLATTDTQDYQARLLAAQAALAQAQAQVAMAQRTVDNNKTLLKQGFISATAADIAVQQLDASQAGAKVAQANIELAQKALKDTRLVSPIAGVVTEKLISAGDKVSPDMKAFTITQPGAIEFEGSLPAAEAALLRLGQTITVETEGLPVLSVKLTRLNAAVNAASRSVTFYAALKDAANYRSGSYATGKVLVKSTHTLAVPAVAVREEGGRSVIYTIDAGNSLTASPVTVGLRGEDASGQAFAAIEGVPSGTRYISRNLGPLRVGSTAIVGK